jgi:hypothetical protein
MPPGTLTSAVDTEEGSLGPELSGGVTLPETRNLFEELVYARPQSPQQWGQEQPRLLLSGAASVGEKLRPTDFAPEAQGSPPEVSLVTEARISLVSLEAPSEAMLPEYRRRQLAAIDLLNAWLADDSGYDERTWPELKKAIEESRTSYRRRFSD